LEMQVAEEDELVPAAFDNLVWFSDQELIDLLRARVPLFDGRLPLGGNLAAEVSAALNAVLAERNIAGQAEYFENAQVNGPITAYLYKVTFHPVTIRNADFPGAAPPEIPALQEAAKQVAGKDYSRSAMRAQEQFSLLPVYLAHGYLKATFSESHAKVVRDGAQTIVDVSFPVTPGVQYQLSSLKFGGYRAFPEGPLRDLIHMKPGEHANAVQLEEDIRAIQKLYGTKGYLEVQVHPRPTMADSAATVHYDLEVAEGAQYHMGELKIDGLPEDTTKRLIAQWQLKKGDAFDDSYLAHFFNVMYADTQLGRSYNVIPKQSVDAQSKTADIHLHFVPKN
jgi:outer membrane protein assembly factor BamA